MATKAEKSTSTDLEARLEALLQEMSLEEQVSLLAGASLWLTVPLERLGVPAIKLSDGPNGARGGGALIGGVAANCFPVGISLAATWNTTLVEQVGQGLAEEAHSKGARVLLGPTMNIHRSPLNGRNFECYSEDPYLSARIGVAYVKGVQSQGVAATVKHYVGNESEFERMTINSDIDDRSLREIYLPPFEAAVKEGAVWAVMSGYNKVNGRFAGDHPQLLGDILKEEWHFDGVVMSDWFANHGPASVEAGLDLEMPGPPRERGAKLLQAVRAGQVNAEAVRDSARRILRLIARVGAFANPTIAEEQHLDRPEQRALIRQAGAEGIVLFKNNGILPLEPNGPTRLAVIGPNAKTAQIMGGGSAQVNAPYRVSPYEGIAAQAGPTVELSYELGCTNYKYLPLLSGQQISANGRPGFSVEYFNSLDLSGPVVWREQAPEAEVMWLDATRPALNQAHFSVRLATTFKPETSGEYHFSLVSAGLSRLFIDGRLVVDNWANWQPGESYFTFGSQEVIGTLELQAGQAYALTVEYSRQKAPLLAAVRLGAFRPLGEAAIERAVALAASADVAIVCAGLTGEWDSEGQDRPHMELVGRQNELISRVAAANPQTVVVLQSGGPVTMPWLDQVAAVIQAWYPGQECGNAIADVLLGRVNPSGKLPQTFPQRLEDNPAFINYPGENGRVRYGEGIFVGYRYYDKKKVEPLFPFGFGLSYTSFSYSNLALSATAIAPDEGLTVSLEVTNTGQRPGQEVVQLYVRDVTARLARPPKELKGFAKVNLRPGETQTVTLTLERQALAYWDDAQQAWVAEAGEFELLAGNSSQDIRARANFHVTGTAVFGGPAQG
jgi:beta-glucosidase